MTLKISYKLLYYHRDVAQFGTAIAMVVQNATEHSEALGVLLSTQCDSSGNDFLRVL